MSTPEAVLAYDESLAAVQYITETYGMSDVRASWNASATARRPKLPCALPCT